MCIITQQTKHKNLKKQRDINHPIQIKNISVLQMIHNQDNEKQKKDIDKMSIDYKTYDIKSSLLALYFFKILKIQ